MAPHHKLDAAGATPPLDSKLKVILYKNGKYSWHTEQLSSRRVRLPQHNSIMAMVMSMRGRRGKITGVAEGGGGGQGGMVRSGS